MGEQAKHTAEPWFWAEDSHGQRTSLMRSGSGDYVVCPQADVGDYGLSVNPWNDVSDADAILIAAAPELLAALKQLHLKTVVGTDAERHAALNDAWAAIAKAEASHP